MKYSVNYRYGKIGITGEKGDVGIIGDKSDVGQKGIIGIKGPSGEKGSSGRGGLKGDLGIEGSIGKSSYDIEVYKGIKGETGLNKDKLIDIRDNETCINFKYEYDDYSIEKKKIKGLKGDIGNPGLKGYSYQDINEINKGAKGKNGDSGSSYYSLENITLFKNSNNYLFRQIYPSDVGFINSCYVSEKKHNRINDVDKYGFISYNNTYIEYDISVNRFNQFYLMNFNYDNLLGNNFNKLNLINTEKIISSEKIFKNSMEKIIDIEKSNMNYTSKNVYYIYTKDPFIIIEKNEFYKKTVINNIQNGYIFKNLNALHVKMAFNCDAYEGGFFIDDRGKFIFTDCKVPNFSSYFGYYVIDNSKYYIPVSLYIRLELYLVSNDDNLNKKLHKYSDWITVDKNGTYNVSNVCWYNYQASNISEITTLHIRYTFGLPYNIILGKVTQSCINDSSELSDYFDLDNITSSVNKNTLQKYNLLDDYFSNKVSLTHLLFSKIQISELIIKIS